MAKVKANFDFESGGPSELSFVADEVLTVIQKDIGEGWWEARNFRGQSGLIPSSYVEVLSPGAVPPRPSLSAVAMAVGRSESSAGNTRVPEPAQRFSESSAAIQAPPSAGPSLVSQSSQASTNNNDEMNDWTDDEWDDSDPDDDAIQPPPQAMAPSYNNTTNDSSVVVLRPRSTRTLSQRSLQTAGTLRQRFTKSATDAFLFDHPPSIQPSDTIVISQGAHGPVWQFNPKYSYSCVIASPKVAKKFHGMKSFVSYQITPSFSNIQVSRRYKQFYWLHQRLVSKFITIAIPPLPSRQIAGRFEDEFVSTRLKQLQSWIDRMCQHPIVARSEVFIHFLSCTDEKKWTAGKRKAEKEDFSGDKLFFTVEPHLEPMTTRVTETQIEIFNSFVRNMDESLKLMTGTMERSAKKYEDSFSKHYRKVGQSFGALSHSFELDDRPESRSLTAAVSNTGRTYEEIGDLCAKQPANDACHLIDGLHQYKGILSMFPNMFFYQKTVLGKVQDKEDSGRATDAEIQEAKRRADIVTYSMMAESQHFHHHRVIDFRAYIQRYLNEQIEFHKMITAKLEAAARQYDHL